MAAERSSQIGKDTARTLVFAVLSMLIGAVNGIVIARYLGPAGKGVFSGVQVLQGGIGALTAGAGSAITYLLTKQGKKLNELIGALSALFSVVSLLGWFVLAAWGLRHGFNTTLYVVALIVPASVLLSWQGYLYMGLGRIKDLNYQSLARMLGIFILILLLVVVFRLGVVGALIAWGAGLYASAIVMVWSALKETHVFPTPDFGSNFGQLVRFGSLSALFGFLGFLNYRVDSLVIIAFLGLSGFGVYSVAVAAGESLFMIPRALSMAVSHDIGARDRVASAAMTAKAVRTSTFAMFIIAIPVATVAPMLIHFVYGARFDPASTVLRILLPGVIVYAANGTFSSFFAYQLGRPIALVYFATATFAIETAICLLLVPRLGLNGAALASTGTYFFAAVGYTLYFWLTAKVSPREVWLIRREDFAAFRQLIRELKGGPMRQRAAVGKWAE